MVIIRTRRSHQTTIPHPFPQSKVIRPTEASLAISLSTNKGTSKGINKDIQVVMKVNMETNMGDITTMNTNITATIHVN